jgi:hypothetical protein
VTRAVTATNSVVDRTSSATRSALERMRAILRAIAARPAWIAVPAGAALAVALAVLITREWDAHRFSLKLPAAAALVPATPERAMPPQPQPQPLVTEPTQPAASAARTLPDAHATDSAAATDAATGAPSQPSEPSASAAATQSTAPTASPAPTTAPIEAASARPTEGQPPAPVTAAAAIDAYAAQAKQQIFEGSPATALQTLATARRKYAGSPVLKNLEIVGDRVEEEVERINMAPTLNVKDHEAWIAEIRELSGDDFPAIAQMLARTLANDIADQRARADRPAVIARLLESGRKLFPEHADLLEHGTAGVLDPSQIVVAEEPTEPAQEPAQEQAQEQAQVPATADAGASASASK